MAFKRYIVSYLLENWAKKDDFVIARTEKEAKRKIKKWYGRKATGIEIKGEG